ncbi:MAG: glycosyltransferase family 4 protein [Nitrospirota bacterium]
MSGLPVLKNGNSLGDILEMSKTKILYISHSPYINGAEICLLTLLKYLNKSQYEPVVIFPSDGPLVDEIKQLSINTYIVPQERWLKYPFDNFLKDVDIQSRVRQIVDIIDKESIRIVHTNTSVVYEGALAAKMRNIPHIWHIHETLEDHPELKPIIPLTVIHWAIAYLSDAIITPANMVKQQFLNVIEPSKLHTIYNGIDSRQFENVEGASLRAELGLADDDIIAVSVGGLTERKGYVNLLQAAALARQQNRSIQFVWAGPASDESLHDFVTKAQEWDVQDTVHYLGFRKDAPLIIKGADMFILPSMNEAFPLVILEAMASSKAVIATDCGGVRECVIDGETGFIVPVNDSAYLANRINDLVNDKTRMKEMGEKGYIRFKERYTADLFAKRFEQIYSDMLMNAKQPMMALEHEIFTGVMDAFQRHIDNLRNLKEQDRMLRDKNDKINEILHHVNVRDELLAVKARQCAETEAALTTIVNSRSWRMTAPLRWLKNMIMSKTEVSRNR